jgi:hypothetical protein
MKALLSNNTELKQFVAVSTGMDITALLPYLSNSPAEQQIINICGQTLYTEMVTKYNNDSLTPPQQALLPYLQKPLANLAVYHHIQQGGVVISNSGVTLTTDREKQAYQWQQLKLEKSLLNQAYFGMDSLIAYLIANQADFPTWSAESDYAQSKNYFINAAADFSKWVDIKSNYRTLVALRPIMHNIEQGPIKNTLSPDFYTALKASIKADTLTSEEKELITNYISPALAHLTIAQGIKSMYVEITAEGALLHSLKSNTNNSQEQNAPDAEQRDALIRHYTKQGEAWMETLADHLNETATELIFPLYYNSTQYTDPATTSPGYFPPDESKIYY